MNINSLEVAITRSNGQFTNITAPLVTQFNLFNEPANIELTATAEGYEGRIWSLTEPRPFTPQVTLPLDQFDPPHVKPDNISLGTGSPLFSTAADLVDETILIDNFKLLTIVNVPTEITIVNQSDSTTRIGIFDFDGLSDPINGVDLASFELNINGGLIPVEQCINSGLCSLFFGPEGKTAALIINFDLSNFCVKASVFDFQGIQYFTSNK